MTMVCENPGCGFLKGNAQKCFSCELNKIKAYNDKVLGEVKV